MRQTYTFGCPVCCKMIRSDEPGEPCCTGPSETRDEHDLTTMRLISVAKTEVNPLYAEKRSAAGLIMPGMEEKIEREVRILRA